MPVERRFAFTAEAKAQLQEIANSPAKKGLHKQLLKTLHLLRSNPRHPGLRTHRYIGLVGPSGEPVWEAYVQNRTPGAYRVFFCYGPDIIEQGKRQAVITVVKLTPHP